MKTKASMTLIALGSLVWLSTPGLAAPPADWSQIPTKTVKLFYPGQSSYQWLRSPAHKRASSCWREGGSPLTSATGSRSWHSANR